MERPDETHRPPNPRDHGIFNTNDLQIHHRHPTMTTNSTRSDAPANKPGLYAGIQAFADSIRPIPLTEAEPSRLTVGGHHEWREGISNDSRPFDEIDRSLDDEIEIDPYITGTNNRRSDKELNRMLDLIDNLPISTNGKEGSH